MLADFRAFIMRGNVLDLAVGVVIGAAFGAIVTSLVNDIIMPPIGMLMGGVDFSDLKIVLKEAVSADVPEVAIYYGRFINAVISFLIIALAVFLMVRAFTRMQDFASRKKVEEAKAEMVPTTEELMLEELKAMRAAMEHSGPPRV